jgi:flavin-dependent dehydrogenase
MNRIYDAVIVGASFAGLAAAMQLRDHRVLLLNQHPVGSHPMSACGTPLATAKAVGAAAATQEIHHALVLHTAGSTFRFDLQDPYVTFDYQTFCRAMLAQTDAEFRQIRAIELHNDQVLTEQGVVSARFVVNAAGWRLQAAQDSQGAAASQVAGYGLETELPVRLPQVRGMHFYFEKQIVSNGYAWVFPCGDSVRIGIGSFVPGVKLRPRLEEFLNRFDLRIGATHGGVLAIQKTEPLVGHAAIDW